MENLKLPSDQDISGRNLGEEELSLLKEVIQSGVLNSTKGSKVARFEKEFAASYGSKHCVALASGTAGIHAAIHALGLEPYDEVITTPITDMGAISPIIYEDAVPVFADIDPLTYNLTAASIQKKITSKTKALIVTHLFGNPCPMNEILALARRHHLRVIEDCAQSFLATHEGKNTGTLGHVGVFSMQQGKHMTTGEGGIVITDDDALARRMRLFVNKAWGYGDAKPDHYFLALNYRLTELQGAVAIAQLGKLKDSVSRRQASARRLDQKLSGIAGIGIPKAPLGGSHAYWKYCLDVNADILGFDVMELSHELKNFGIACNPRYIQKPAFHCEALLFLKEPGEDCWKNEYPGAYHALKRVLVLPWNEFYTEAHVDFIAEKILTSIKKLKNRAVAADSGK